MANLVCIPFTEKLSIRSHEETMAKEIILAASWESNRATIREPCSRS